MADIDSGKLQSSERINDDGTIEIFNPPEGFIREGAESVEDFIFTGE